IPRRAMTRAGRPIVSRPSKTTEPARLPMMPMIDFSVVVLPAPLRPRRVTTSPGFTSKRMPCSTWLSPYQASRSRTARRGAAVEAAAVRARAASAMAAGSDIGLDHLRVLRHAGVLALRQHAAAGEHRDPVRQGGDDREIVLDHQDGSVRRNAADQLRDALDILVAHAGHGL